MLLPMGNGPGTSCLSVSLQDLAMFLTLFTPRIQGLYNPIKDWAAGQSILQQWKALGATWCSNTVACDQLPAGGRYLSYATDPPHTPTPALPGLVVTVDD